MKKAPEDYSDLVRILAELFDEIGPESPDELDAVLRQAGFNPDEVAARINHVARQALRSSSEEWRATARKEMEDDRTRLERMPSEPLRGREDVIKAIGRLVASISRVNPAWAPSTEFRNLDQVSDADLAGILNELEYLASKDSTETKGPIDSND